jgi:integrase
MTDRTSDGGRQGKRKGRRMFGTVRKLPSGRWQARYWDDKGRRQTAPHTFLTKADAARYLALVEADLTRGLFHDPRRGAIPFGEWADRWMDNAELRPTTRDLYGYLLRRFIKPTFEAVTLAEIDDVMVEDWLAELRTRPKLSSSTIAKAYRLLARILGAAVKQRYILHTTWRIEGAGKEHAAKMRCASPEQINALADAVAPRYRALVLVAGYGGLRWGELVGLRRHRVDLTARTVQVAEQVTEINAQFRRGVPKSEAGLRSVALPRFVVKALDEHLTTWAEPGAAGLVFPAAEGGWMRRSNFRRRVWLPATKAVGVEGLRFHDLRPGRRHPRGGGRGDYQGADGADRALDLRGRHPLPARHGRPGCGHRRSARRARRARRLHPFGEVQAGHGVACGGHAEGTRQARGADR